MQKNHLILWTLLAMLSTATIVSTGAWILAGILKQFIPGILFTAVIIVALVLIAPPIFVFSALTGKGIQFEVEE